MVCPKCGAMIARFDLSPNCKSCGVNMFYYSQEIELARDAKRTELEFAGARALVAKLKGNFVAGKIPIARIVFFVLTIAVMCIPYFSITFALPMSQVSFSTGLIGAYDIYSASVFQIFPALWKLQPGGSVTVCTAVSVLLFAAAVLLEVSILVVYLLSFMHIRKSARALTVLSFINAAVNLGAFAGMYAARAAAAQIDGITVSFCFGALVSFAMLTVFACLNLYMAKHGQAMPLREVDLKRLELYKLYKKKQLDLDTLPLPIYETEEERMNRLNMISGASAKKEAKNHD